MSTIAKFGGSSVATPERLRACAQIVRDHSDVTWVVVSATGKTTQELEDLMESAVREKHFSETLMRLEKIEVRHLEMCTGFPHFEAELAQMKGILQELKNLVQGLSLLKINSPKIRDNVLSIGERLSAPLMVLALREAGVSCEFVDVRKLLITDEQFGKAQVLIPEFHQKVNNLKFEKKSVKVISGYIGSTLQGDTSTLGKEGSDYTATLFAQAVGADLVQIWKDVPGIMSSDPDVVSDAVTLPELTFDEMQELSALGAKVLHPLTLSPCVERGIPVEIRSSFDVNLGGTKIVAKRITKGNSDSGIFAVTSRSQLQLIKLTANSALDLNTFYLRTLELPREFQLNIELLSAQNDLMTFIVQGKVDLPGDFLLKLHQLGKIQHLTNLTQVSVIGHDFHKHNQQLGQVVTAATHFIAAGSLKQLHFGTSALGVSFLVDESCGMPLLQYLHQQFIGTRV